MNTNRNQSCYGNSSMNRNTGYANPQKRCSTSYSALDGPYHSNMNKIDQFPIGMAYVPWQEFKDLYDPHQGLCHGTIFKELDYPFYGKRGNCR